MKENMWNKVAIAALVLALAACKAHKQVIREDAAVKPAARAADLAELRKIESAQLQFNTFSAKAKAKLELNGSNNDVTMNIRIRRGQKIWISVTAFAGIEVARALITPDSLQVVNKLQGLYLRKPFSYIDRYAGGELDYRSLEALFVGNAIPQLLNRDGYMRKDKGTVELSGSLHALAYRLVFGPDSKVLTSTLADSTMHQSIQVNNGDFMQAAGRSMPSEIDISSMANRRKAEFHLHYVRAEFDQALEYPFSIPDGYSAAK